MSLRLISFIFVLCLPIASYADVILLNKSEQSSSLEISYQFCHAGEYEDLKCDQINTVNIESGEKNYIKIPTPEIPANSMYQQYIEILSANAKDRKGNIVAQAIYQYGPLVADYDSTGEKYTYEYVINFDFIQKIGIISSDVSQYNYSGPSVLKASSKMRSEMLHRSTI